jgi:hypothetical protein
MLVLDESTLEQFAKTSKSRDRLNDICKKVKEKNSKKKIKVIKKLSKAS